MRMRKKKNLEARLEAVGDMLFISDSPDRNFNTAVIDKAYIDLKAWFNNDNPVFLEIGCGKGKFACEYAKSHPEINLLAVEKNSNVIVQACEAAKNAEVKNLRFMKCGAEYLEKYLKENSVDRIFLNFSCPFPKNSYASHRLTHKNFLEIYKRILKDGGGIFFKTDNRGLFDFSLEEFKNFGMRTEKLTYDLHNSEYMDGNVMTEYEKRFSSMGVPINRVECYFE